jgi:putative nucleotidyltransferase with HDIG domain
MNPSEGIIPDIQECLALMDQYHMLPNIKDHSIVVAGVAQIIAEGLINAGQTLSMAKILGGALLHDIGKTACLDNEDDHAAKGVEICLVHNLAPIADIVAEHVILRNTSTGKTFSETEIVYYADKRVNHDQVVNLEERLAYILDRYGANNLVLCEAIKRNYKWCRNLEERMFALLEFQPEEIGVLLKNRKTSF